MLVLVERPLLLNQQKRKFGLKFVRNATHSIQDSAKKWPAVAVESNAFSKNTIYRVRINFLDIFKQGDSPAFSFL